MRRTASLLGGGGVDGAIHRAAGPELFANAACCTAARPARRRSRAAIDCRRVTSFIRSARCGGAAGHDEEALLASCYRDIARAGGRAQTGIARISRDLNRHLWISRRAGGAHRGRHGGRRNQRAGGQYLAGDFLLLFAARCEASRGRVHRTRIDMIAERAGIIRAPIFGIGDPHAIQVSLALGAATFSASCASRRADVSHARDDEALELAGCRCRIRSSTMMMTAGVLEIVGGVLLAIGLFSRPVAFVLSGLMAFAYFLGHASRGFFPRPQWRRAGVAVLLRLPLHRGRRARSLERRRSARPSLSSFRSVSKSRQSRRQQRRLFFAVPRPATVLNP